MTIIEIIPKTTEEFLKSWDDGKSVQTVNMGGLGTGYDLAIQCLAMEIIRALTTRPHLSEIMQNTQKGEKYPDELMDEINEVVGEVDAKQTDGTYKLGGLSAAQVGAAKNLAFIIAQRGYEAVYEVEADRLCFMKKQNPVELYNAVNRT